MYLEEVTLDGFKSYSQRVTVGPFHQQFNAITGLNGSGKSNILDAICFVMGIRSLAQMRVNKQDELVYKSGQSGITKASVTLNFNNTDKKTSPPAYADKDYIAVTRQVVIGGRDRFLVNSKVVRVSDVHTLFHSVQLNVNNPHFLIMQGRITKVINMKAHEILGMIEEAAGTKMYETKRTESERKIERKDAQLKEIENLLQEEIYPGLRRLQKERETYVKWTENSVRLDRLRRVVLWLAWTEENSLVDTLAAKKADLETKRREKENLIQTLNERLLQIQRETESSEKSMKQKKMQEEVNDVKAELQRIEKEMAGLVVNVKAAKEDLKREEDGMASLQKRKNAVMKKQRDIAKSNEDGFRAINEASETLQNKNDTLQRAQDELEGLRTGKEGITEGSKQSLRSTLMTEKERLLSLESDVKISKNNIKQYQKECSILAKKLQTASKENQEIDAKKTEVNRIHEKIKKLESDAASLGVSQEMVQTEKSAAKVLEQELQGLRNSYDDDVNGGGQARHRIREALSVHKEFPKSQNDVLGPAFALIRIHDAHVNYAIALEEAGKARLLHILVHDDEVAKKVFEKYSNVRRVTCIPLNKVRGPEISKEKLRKAKSTSKEQDAYAICSPLEVVEPSDPDYTAALKYVFGAALLCKDKANAARIMNDPGLKLMTITEAGDTYNPSGAVSGGSSAGLGGLLMTYRRQLETSHLISEKKKQLDECYNIIKEMEKRLQACVTMMHTRDREIIRMNGLEHAIEGLQINSEEGQHADLQKRIAVETEKIQELEETIIPRLRDQEIPRLESQLRALGASREERVAQCQKEIKQLKNEIKVLEKEYDQQKGKTMESHNMVSVLQKEEGEIEEEITTAQQRIVACIEHLKNLEELVSNKDGVIGNLHKELEEKQALLKNTTEGVVVLTEERNKIESEKTNEEAAIVRIAHQVDQHKKELSERKKRQSARLRDAPWLKDESFDEGMSAASAKQELEMIEAEQVTLSRTVNKKAAGLLQAAERQCEELQQKHQQVLKDKISIEEFIAELDAKKRETIDSCWHVVNDNFRAVFSTLLPGADATLICASDNIEAGFEMKVGFNGIWKKGLVELSGGQRSLLALSLILALLKFKPAPFYILDEIDAALDLSHTQNIGRMIQLHFSGSQFIVVSLKENLFNYADVLFRTSFADGSSRVTRFENSKD